MAVVAVPAQTRKPLKAVQIPANKRPRPLNTCPLVLGCLGAFLLPAGSTHTGPQALVENQLPFCLAYCRCRSFDQPTEWSVTRVACGDLGGHRGRAATPSETGGSESDAAFVSSTPWPLG